MQPLLTQVPPNRLRSIIATFIPVSASRTARDGPAWPVPITIASYLVAIGIPPLRLRSSTIFGFLPAVNVEICPQSEIRCPRRKEDLYRFVHPKGCGPLAGLDDARITSSSSRRSTSKETKPAIFNYRNQPVADITAPLLSESGYARTSV